VTAIELKNEVAFFLKNAFGSVFTWEFARIALPVVILWEIIPRAGWVPRGLMPPPSTVFFSFWELLTQFDLLGHIGISLFRFTAGFLIAVALAIPLGLLMGWSMLVRKHMLPFMQLLSPIPPPAWVPLTIIVLGIGFSMQIFIVFLGVFYPVLFNTYTATRDTNKRFINAARLFGASEMTILRQVVVPSSVSSILMGMKIGTAMGIVCVVISELFGASSGLGWLLSESKDFYRIDRMIVTMAILGSIGWFMIELLKYFEIRWSGWKVGEVSG